MSRARSPTRSFTSVASVLVLSLAFACSDGGGDCGATGCGSTYDYPQSSLPNGVAAVQDAARARLTQAGLDFLQARLPGLLEGLDSGFATEPTNPEFFRIEVGSEIEILATPRTALGVDADGDWLRPTVFWLNRTPLTDDLNFQLVEGDPEGVVAHVENLVIGLDGHVFTSFGISEAACTIRGTNNSVCPPEATDCDTLGLLTTVTFDLLIRPRIGSGSECDDPALGDCFRIDVDVSNVVLGDFDSSAIEIDTAERCNVAVPPADCSGECSDTSFLDSDGDAECVATCGAQDFLTDLVAGIGGALEGVLDSVLDGFVEDALGNALGDIDGAPSTVSGRLVLADLLAGLPTGQAMDLGFSLQPTDETFDVNCAPNTDCAQARGMDILLRTGVEAAPAEPPDPQLPPHPCVEPLEGAAFEALYGAAEFAAPVAAPLTGEFEGQPYHFGASITRAALNQALFGVYNSGALCLELDTDDVHTLTDGAFPLSAGTINTLSGQRLEALAAPTAPAIVTVVPSQPPVVRFSQSADGDTELLVDWDDVEVSFYVYLWDRFARVFAVEADIAMTLALTIDADTQEIQFAISDGPTIDDFEETYSELLPSVGFDDVLESLLGVVFDQLLGDALSFSFDLGLDTLLSDATGLPLGLDFHGVETIDVNGEGEFISLYFSLTDSAPQPRYVSMPDRLRVAAKHEDHWVLQGTSLRLSENIELLARVDGGAWRGPLRPRDGVVMVADPKLRFVGMHKVELRARAAQTFSSWRTIAPVRAWHDPIAPHAQLQRRGDLLVADGVDEGTPADALVFAWARDGRWGSYDEARTLPLEELVGVRRVSLRAMDRAGNVSTPVTIDLQTRAFQLVRQDVSPQPVERSSGCAAASGAPGAGSLYLLAALAFVLRRRARGAGLR